MVNPSYLPCYLLLLIHVRIRSALSLVSNFSPLNHRHDIKTWHGTAYRRRRNISLHNTCKDSKDDEQQNNNNTRRKFLKQTILLSSSSTIISSLLPSSNNVANARGLIRFPCKELLNTYHFMRSGSSLLEIDNVWSTNPLFLTNREAALSDLGQEQVINACTYLKSTTGIQPTVVRYSLAAASIDSANIVGEQLNIGRDRLVPEFNYMDPRAIGAWDFAALNATEEAVWAMDADEGGVYGKGGRPPPNEDGTPAESIADSVVRLTNLMSVLETLYSGDTVLLIFPDGTGPAALSCLIGGIPLNRVHELQFQPGEIRVDVNYNSINALASQPPTQAYLDTLQRGRVELKELRANPDLLRNVKDLAYEEERKLEVQALDAKQKEVAKEKELERQRKREARLLQAQNGNSLDFNSLGFLGAGIAAGTVVLSTTLGSDENEEIIDAGKNTTDTHTVDTSSSLNSTIPATVDSGGIIETTETEGNLLSDDEEEEEEEEEIDVKVSSAAAAETYEDDWLTGISEIMKEESDNR